MMASRWPPEKLPVREADLKADVYLFVGGSSFKLRNYNCAPDAIQGAEHFYRKQFGCQSKETAQRPREGLIKSQTCLQRLKPHCEQSICGTAEAVPLTKAGLIRGFLGRGDS